jgi:hypothetical protein
MRKTAIVLLVIGCVWIILVGGCGYFSLVSPGILTRWRQEPPPPELLTHLALGEAGEVIGSVSNGTRFEFRYGNYGSDSEWVEVTEPSGNPAIGADCSPGDGNRIVLPPPGEARSRASMNCIYMESAYHLEVALLENGEVWSWENERYAYAELFIMLSLLCVGAMGAMILLVGAGLWIYWKCKNDSGNSKIEQVTRVSTAHKANTARGFTQPGSNRPTTKALT